MVVIVSIIMININEHMCKIGFNSVSSFDCAS